MKKQLLLKNTTRASLALIAMMTSQSLMAQAGKPVPVGSDDSSNVLRLLTSDKAVDVNVTPDGIEGDTHAISITRGDVLTIHGTVDELLAPTNPINPNTPVNLNNPNKDSKLEYVELTLGKTKNITSNPLSITLADRKKSTRINGDELNNNTFDFHITGDHKGEQRVTLRACWTVNGETQETKKYPVIVTVR